jgi:type I restriction-modification system DNA methylase subunit
MLAQGSGLFRVERSQRSPKEIETLAGHPWQARLETLLEEAKEHGAHWVYFRLVSDVGGPKPEIYIFDHSSTLGSGPPLDLASLHRNLWNYGKVPLAIVLRATVVDVFSLLQPPAFSPDGALVAPKPMESLALSPADMLATAGAAAVGIVALDDAKWQRFSGARFDNGSFWEELENRDIGTSEKNSVDTMVEEMREVRRKLEVHFSKAHKLPDDLAKYSQPFIHRLLILTLMVRFMEERGIIPPGYFQEKEHLDAKEFKSLLRHRTPLLRAFDRLANDFNGDIFTLADSADPAEVPMRRILQDLPDPEKALSLIADFADGRMQGEECHFWQRYSFRHLPVEAISYVYEDFLGNKSQSYFTPHHLVNLMLDEAMQPQNVAEALLKNDPRVAGSQPAFPVLDPSCGSGVFLVGAWHRLVEAFRLIDPTPTPEVLKRLMQQNIYGVDVEHDSVELTIFSLCVALCSEFPHKADDPNFTFNKLRELKFPNLKSSSGVRRNIHARDFFTERPALMNAALRFKLVIGNPPFESKLIREAETAFDELSPDEAGKTWGPVPDDNISYLFLRAVPPLLAENGTACLIQNASLLYNDKPKAFRKALITNWHVPEILDFASIGGLFKKRKPAKNGELDQQVASRVKVVAVMLERREPDFTRPLLHATFRRTSVLDECGIFEIDPQDLHWTPRHVAAEDPRLWTANLLGGGRLLETYNRLTEGETLKSHLARLEKQRNWLYSEGFIEGTPTPPPLSHRKDWKFLPTEAFIEDSIPNETELTPLGIVNFERSREDRLFMPPHLLMKKNDGVPVVLRLSGEALLFRAKIVGIAAPDTETDREELQRIYNYLKQNRKATDFFIAFGSQYLIFRVGVPPKSSLDDLPYPKDGKVLFHGVQAYLRDDVIDFMIPLVKDAKNKQTELARDTEATEVEAYSRVFLEVMRSAFPDLQSSGKPHDLGRAWCLAFHRGEGKGTEFGDTEALKKYLDGLLMKKMGRALRCWRIVRQFHGKNIYIVKPKPRRYWLKSAAVRDADDMFASWSRQALTKRSKD